MRFQTLINRNGRECAGTLVSLSRQGAFVVTNAEQIPPPGEKVRLRIELDPAVELEGRVVGTMGDGFAVEFSATNVGLLELLEDLGTG